MRILLFNSCFSHSVMSDSLWPHGLQPAQLLCLWNFLGKSTGVGCHSLLQGIFLIQGSNLCLLYCRQIFTIWATRKPYLILTTPLYLRRFYYHPQLYMRKQRYMRCHKTKTRSHTSQNTGLWFELTPFKGQCRCFTTSFFISLSYQNIVLTWLM